MVSSRAALSALVMQCLLLGSLSYRSHLALLSQTQIDAQKEDHGEGRVMSEFGDIDSDMSEMLHKAGVIREDTYNKPGNKYTLKLQTGDYERGAFKHGIFKFGGAYGGMLAGGTAGGLPGMMAGGAAGMAAGDRAATMLERIMQGQASIGISDDWKEKGAGPGRGAAGINMDWKATNSMLPMTTGQNAPQWSFMSSLRSILQGGNRSTDTVDSILQDAASNKPAVDALLHSPPDQSQPAPTFLQSLMAPYMQMQNTEKTIISGLNTALQSDDPTTVEDAKITAALLGTQYEINRHEKDGVEVIVE